MSEKLVSPSRLLPRRAFVQVAGATAATAALVLAGCSTDTVAPTDPNQIILQSDDAGLLNVAYLLAQLQAALYQLVISSPPTDLQPGELAYFTDMRDHEVVHREALKYALGTTAALPALAFNFTSLTLTTRAGALAAARTLADLSSAAYPSLLPFFSSAVTRNLVFKMSSVEARHAALVRELLQPGSFAGADVVDANGLEILKTPADVVAATAAYLVTFTISVANVATL